MMFVKKTIGNEIYIFDVFEKWWYCFFLFLAWFLPHKCYAIDIDERNRVTKPRKVNPILSASAMVFGLQIGDLLPKDVLYVIKNRFIYYVIIYLLSVLIVYIVSYIIRLKQRKYRKSEFIHIRIKVFQVATLKALIRFSFPIALPIFIFIFTYDNIDLRMFIVILSALTMFTIVNIACWARFKYRMVDKTEYYIGAFNYIEQQLNENAKS